MKIMALILAAGKGTRMKSSKTKVMHEVNGIPMIGKIDSILTKSGIEEKLYILGHKKEDILLKYSDFSYVVQEEQLGTAHAVMVARDRITCDIDNVLILCGDTPLIREETINKIIGNHISNNSSVTILTTEFDNPFGYGRIVKNDKNNVIAIVEEQEADNETKKIKEINTGIYCFKREKLLEALENIDNNNSKGEYYLTDAIAYLSKKNEIIQSINVENNIEVMGINTKVELEIATRELRERKNIELMQNGVILIDKNTVYIEENVIIDEDTIIYPNVTIIGNTEIGKNCKILSNSRIENSIIKDNVKIDASVIEDSIIDDGVTMGPFAHLRPKSELGKNVHIGNFVEVKKSKLEDGVKAGHLTYIGDAVIGEKTNIGAGTITCNYDGKNKFQTKIGKNVFVGSNTKFVAPVNIENNVYIGAGSTITKDVNENSLAISREKQVEIKNWVLRKQSK